MTLTVTDVDNYDIGGRLNITSNFTIRWSTTGKENRQIMLEAPALDVSLARNHLRSTNRPLNATGVLNETRGRLNETLDISYIRGDGNLTCVTVGVSKLLNIANAMLTMYSRTTVGVSPSYNSLYSTVYYLDGPLVYMPCDSKLL